MQSNSAIEIHSADIVRIDRMRGVFSRADLVRLVLDHFLQSMAIPVGMVVNEKGQPVDYDRIGDPLRFRPFGRHAITEIGQPDADQATAGMTAVQEQPATVPAPPVTSAEPVAVAPTAPIAPIPAAAFAGLDDILEAPAVHAAAPELAVLTASAAAPAQDADIFAKLRELDDMMTAPQPAAAPAPVVSSASEIPAAPTELAAEDDWDPFSTPTGQTGPVTPASPADDAALEDDMPGWAPAAQPAAEEDPDFDGAFFHPQSAETSQHDDFPGFSEDSSKLEIDQLPEMDDEEGAGEDPAPSTFGRGGGGINSDAPRYNDHGDLAADARPKPRPIEKQVQLDSFKSIISKVSGGIFGGQALDPLASVDAPDDIWIGTEDLPRPADASPAPKSWFDNEDEAHPAQEKFNRPTAQPHRGATVAVGDIILYQQVGAQPGGNPTSFVLLEIDTKVEGAQKERAINYNSETIYTYQPAGKALIGAAPGAVIGIKVPARDPMDIKILTIIKPDEA